MPKTTPVTINLENMEVVRNEIANLRAALQQIADYDYCGDACAEDMIMIAKSALGIIKSVEVES